MIKVYSTSVPAQELQAIAEASYKDMVKGVVDIDRRILALGGEWHADSEAVLIRQGHRQESLWGFNVYLNRPKETRLEYTSLINIRPRQQNFNIEVQDVLLRQRMKEIIDQLI